MSDLDAEQLLRWNLWKILVRLFIPRRRTGDLPDRRPAELSRRLTYDVGET